MTALQWVYANLAVTTGLFVLWMALQTMRPTRISAGLTLPWLLMTLLPWLFVAWRLRADAGNALALGLAVLLALTAIGLIVAAGWMVFFRISPLVAIMGAPLYLAGAAYGVLQAAVIRSSISALLAADSLVGGLASGVAAAAVLGLAYGLIFVPLSRGMDRVYRNTSFAPDAAQKHLTQVYRTLWEMAGPGAVNGFPASASAIVPAMWWDHTVMPGGDAYGTYYDFRYEPGPPDSDGKVRSFLISAKKKSAPVGWTDSYSLDERGTLRRSVEGWAGRDARAYHVTNTSVAAFMGLCDAWYEMHQCYPRRLIMDRPPKAQPGELSLPHNSYVAAFRIEYGADGRSIVFRYRDGPRQFEYHPAAGDRPQGYTLNWPATRNYASDLRSFLVDEAGQVHVTHELRDATVNDPLDQTEEFQRERAHSREWARDYLRLAEPERPESS